MSEFCSLVFLAPERVPYTFLFRVNIYEVNEQPSGSMPLG